MGQDLSRQFVSCHILSDWLRKTCTGKVRNIQGNLHVVLLIVEHVDNETAPINLNRSKLFDRVDNRFLEAFLTAASFWAYFHPLIRLLFATPGALIEMNGVKSEPFVMSRSIRRSCPLSPLLYLLRKLKANLLLHRILLPPRPGTLSMPTMFRFLYLTVQRLTKSVKRSEGPRSIAISVGVREEVYGRKSQNARRLVWP